MTAPVPLPMMAPIAAPRPPPIAPPRIAPAAPPSSAPPSTSCARASFTGAAMAAISSAAAPKVLFIACLPTEMDYGTNRSLRRPHPDESLAAAFRHQLVVLVVSAVQQFDDAGARLRF